MRDPPRDTLRKPAARLEEIAGFRIRKAAWVFPGSSGLRLFLLFETD